MRTVDTLPAKRMQFDLQVVRHSLTRLFDTAYSATGELNSAYNAQLAGQLAIVLGAVMALDYEPVSLRYFTLKPDGAIHYLTDAEIAASEKKRKPKQKRELAVSVFTNAELTFRKRGDPAAPVKVFRHIAFDLANKALTKDSSLLAHLKAKGSVSAMTKAASHLLWYNSFSTIRDYLLDNNGVDDLRRHRHPADPRARGRVRAGDVGLVFRRVFSPSGRGRGERVRQAVADQPASATRVSLRLPRRQVQQPPDDHAQAKVARDTRSVAGVLSHALAALAMVSSRGLGGLAEQL